MEKETIDRITIAGLVVFVLLGIVYLCWDHITRITMDVSLDPSSASISLPAITLPNLSLDWFYSMDQASQIIFCFIITIIVATLIGGTWMYLVHKRRTGAK